MAYVISGPTRGTTLIDSMRVRQCTTQEEIDQAKNLVGPDAVRSGNDRQYDIWRSLLTTGTVIGPVPAIDETAADLIAHKLAPLLSLLPDADLERIAEAVNDEASARLAAR